MPQKTFPASSVVNWYITAEDMLLDVLRVVPYCRENDNVWSPVLARILQEGCSQLDSLWLDEARTLALCAKSDELNIRDYFEHFGPDVKYKWVVCWGEEPNLIQPFRPWAGLKDSEFRKKNYDKQPKLDWWQAHQRVKHDRIANQRKATLGRAVNAVAALFLAILRCKACCDAILQTGWLSSAPWDSPTPGNTWLKELNPKDTKDKHRFFAAESKLFSYPVGWCKVTIKKGDKWLGNASHRFMLWFNDYKS